ncbi:MAG: winged helix-turn-helix domain-containing protein, partial [Caldilineaceae bacterium]|nr:winged helix-turn-helix domain-containing protein [Caldilineaceae bacterium]
KTPMEYMYLAHANYRPVERGRIAYSAKVTPKTVRIRRSIPDHISTGPDYLDFLNRLEERPEGHHVFDESMTFVPELVFSIDYDADEKGWAHTLQVHPDGGADYVRHRPEQLPIGVRWICRTPDKDALGLVLPSTAEPEGRSAELAKGNVRELEGGGEWRCDYILGTLDAEEVRKVEATIEDVRNKRLENLDAVSSGPAPRSTTRRGPNDPTGIELQAFHTGRAVPVEFSLPLSFGDLTIDPRRREARLGQSVLNLTLREFDLLMFFARNQGIALARDTILEKVWGKEFEGDSRTLDVHIRRLREKIESVPADPRLLRTIWGLGYRFDG